MFLEPLELLDGISFWSFWMSPCNGFLCLPALLEDPEDHKSPCFLDPPWILLDISMTQLQHHVSTFQCLQNSVKESLHCRISLTA